MLDFTTIEAKTTFINKLSNRTNKFGNYFRFKTKSDVENEKQSNRTLAVFPLPEDISPVDVACYFAKFGNLVSVDLPRKVESTNLVNLYSSLNLDEEESSLEDRIVNFLSKQKLSEFNKEKLKYNLQTVSKFLKNFHEISKHFEDANVIQEELKKVKWAISKFIPEPLLNDIINLVSKNNSPLEDLMQAKESKQKEIYNTICSRMINLVKRYTETLVKEANIPASMIPVSLTEADFANENQHLVDPAVFSKAKTTTTSRVNSIFDTPYSVVSNPLADQIKKAKFLLSLTDSELVYLRKNHKVNTTLNTSSFLDYFLQYSRDFGIEMFDKYIELAEMLVAMRPLDRLFFSRRLLSRLKNNYGDYAIGNYDDHYLEDEVSPEFSLTHQIFNLPRRRWFPNSDQIDQMIYKIRKFYSDFEVAAIRKKYFTQSENRDFNKLKKVLESITKMKTKYTFALNQEYHYTANKVETMMEFTKKFRATASKIAVLEKEVDMLEEGKEKDEMARQVKELVGDLYKEIEKQLAEPKKLTGKELKDKVKRMKEEHMENLRELLNMDKQKIFKDEQYKEIKDFLFDKMNKYANDLGKYDEKAANLIREKAADFIKRQDYQLEFTDPEQNNSFGMPTELKLSQLAEHLIRKELDYVRTSKNVAKIVNSASQFLVIK